MLAYQTDRDGFYTGSVEADEDRMSPGTFLLPAGAVFVAPPDFDADTRPRLVDGAWTLVRLSPEVVEPVPPADAPVPDDRPLPPDEPIVVDPEPPVVVDPVPALPFSALVNAERAARFEAGCFVQLVDGAPEVDVLGDAESTRNLSGLYEIAKLQLAVGDDETITYRDGMNVDHVLTPTLVQRLWLASARYGYSLYPASWRIKDMKPRPANVVANELWPSVHVDARHVEASTP